MEVKIRFLHAYPPEQSFVLIGDGAVDILLDEEMIVQELPFGQYTEYMEVKPGRGVLSVYPAGRREQPLVRNNVVIPEDNRYTLVLADREGAAVIAPVLDGEITLADGYAGIRFGNLVPDLDPLSISLLDRYERPDLIFEEVEYGQITEYIVEQESPVAFDIYTKTSDERLMRVPWRQYTAGNSYTIYLLKAGAEEDQKLQAVVLQEEG